MTKKYSKTPDIISISSHHKIEILNPSEIDILRKGTYQLLAEVGVSYLSKKALTIFADHGAEWLTGILTSYAFPRIW